MSSFTVCALVDGEFKSQALQASSSNAAKYTFFSGVGSKAIYILGVFEGTCSLVADELSAHPLSLSIEIVANGLLGLPSPTGGKDSIAQGAIGRIKEKTHTHSGWHYLAQFDEHLYLITEDLFQIGAFSVHENADEACCG